MVVLAIFFQANAVSMHHVQGKDMIFENSTPELSFYRGKGRMHSRLQLMLLWHSDKPTDGSSRMSLSDILQQLLSLLKTKTLENCHYYGQSPRIRGTKSFRFLVSQGMEHGEVVLGNGGDDVCLTRQPYRRNCAFRLVFAQLR